MNKRELKELKKYYIKCNKIRTEFGIGDLIIGYVCIAVITNFILRDISILITSFFASFGFVTCASISMCLIALMSFGLRSLFHYLIADKYVEIPINK